MELGSSDTIITSEAVYLWWRIHGVMISMELAPCVTDITCYVVDIGGRIHEARQSMKLGLGDTIITVYLDGRIPWTKGSMELSPCDLAGRIYGAKSVCY